MISVVIPCHNQGDTLSDAVHSALPASNIIIVDDCSSDDTADIGRDLDMRYSHVIYTHTGADVPAGVVFARNYGISHAPDGVIIPLDADCQLTSFAFNAAYNWAHECFLYGDWLEHDELHQASPIGMVNRKNVAQTTFLFSKAMWRAVGGYSPLFETGYEDWALMCAFIANGYRGIQLDSPLYRSPGAGRRSINARRLHPFLMKILHDEYPEVFMPYAISTH